MINTLLKVLSKQQFGFVTKEDLDVIRSRDAQPYPFLSDAGATDISLKLKILKQEWIMLKKPATMFVMYPFHQEL